MKAKNYSKKVLSKTEQEFILIYNACKKLCPYDRGYDFVDGCTYCKKNLR